MSIKKNGMLEAVERLPNSYYKCLCDCGNERIVRVGHFNSGKIKSCGCHWRTGGTGTREQWSYNNMMNRCHNPNNKRYKDYGQKGIIVCDEWRGNFKQFLKDMGKCPDGFQIDRIDNSKGYSKENCRWASPKENMQNRNISRKWNVFGEVYGSAKDAAKKYNVSESTIYAWCRGRIAKGIYYKPKEKCGFEFIYQSSQQSEANNS